MRLDPHSARYFAHLYSLPPQQAMLDALFGVEREVFASLRPGIDHHVAHSRLRWWRDECERTSAGHAVHPLTRALLDSLRSSPSALTGLSGVVDVAVWDLANATFETRHELVAYCERWARAMIAPVAIAAGWTNAACSAGGTGTTVIDSSGATATSVGAAAAPSSVDLNGRIGWCTLGAAMREIELLNDFVHEAQRGRIRVSLDDLDRANVGPSLLTDIPSSNEVAEIIRQRHRSLRSEIARAVATIDGTQQPPLRGLLVWAALVSRSSERAERALPERLLRGRFDAVSDAWCAWRVARKANVGRLNLS